MGVDAFYDQYQIMLKVNALNNDHYNHAVANSNAVLCGPGGESAAKMISFLREISDFILGGDTFNDKWEDEKANNFGRKIKAGMIPEDYNSKYDTRRGGARAKVNKTPISNQNLIDVMLKQVILNSRM